MNVVLFEDDHLERLYPITLSRPAFAISCGSYRLIDLVTCWQRPFCYVVRPHLMVIVAADYPQPCSLAEMSGDMLLVNAACVPSMSTMQELKRLVADGRPGCVRTGNRIAAVVAPESCAPEPRQLNPEQLPRYLDSMQLESLAGRLPLFEYPHDVVRWHMQILGENLNHRLEQGNYQELESGVFVAEGAKLGHYIVTDTSDGPILLEADASIGPYTYLTGPAYFGRGARVLEHASIKDGVAVGHTTKIGGEVEASIVEPYTNKQHHGFLGHSYLGSRINLGAGTCNSDLKNTYGEVNMEYAGQKVASGMQFMGCVVGDYSKSAINTSIFTGKVIGAGSLLYGFVTTNVPSFVNYARSFGQVSEVPPEVLISTQRRMFARRDVTQRPCDMQLLNDMFDLTRSERQMAGEPLSL